MSAARAIVRLRSIGARRLPAAAVVWCLLAASVPAADRGRAVFPLSDVDHPVATLDVAGQRLRVLVNTGVPRTVIDARFRSLLGNAQSPPEGKAQRPPNANRGYTLHDHVRANVGPIELGLAEVACVDLGELVAGEGVDGFLGMDFLARHTIDFDWDQGQLVLSSGLAKTKPPRAVQVKLSYDAEAVPRVQAQINGHACPVSLDTGWIGPLTLAPADERAVFPNGPARSVSEYGMTSRGILQSRMTRAETLELAGIRARDVLCSVGLPQRTQTRLGSYFLRQYRAVFDFPRDRLLLVERARATPAEADMSGIHLMRRRGKTIVYAVDDDSPAAAAGVTGGDQIIAIDDVPAATLTPAQLRELFRAGDGESLDLKFFHQGSQQSVDLVLRKRI